AVDWNAVPVGPQSSSTMLINRSVGEFIVNVADSRYQSPDVSVADRPVLVVARPVPVVLVSVNRLTPVGMFDELGTIRTAAYEFAAAPPSIRPVTSLRMPRLMNGVCVMSAFCRFTNSDTVTLRPGCEKS